MVVVRVYLVVVERTPPFQSSIENFKQSKNRDESTDFEDFLMESIAWTESFLPTFSGRRKKIVTTNE